MDLDEKSFNRQYLIHTDEFLRAGAWDEVDM